MEGKVEEGKSTEGLTALEHLANLETRVNGAIKDQRVSTKNYMKDVSRLKTKTLRQRLT